MRRHATADGTVNILYLVTSGDMAGGQAVCLTHIHASLDRGHRPMLVSSSLGEFTHCVEKLGLPVVLLDLTRTFRLGSALRLAGLIRRWQAGLVHTHAFVPATILGRIAARLAGVPAISHIHIENAFSSKPWIRSLQIWADNFSARQCFRVIAVSQATKHSLVKQGVPEAQIEVVHNGVPILDADISEWRREIRRQLGMDPGAPVIGHVGRLTPQKGQARVLSSARRILHSIPEARFVFVGEDLAHQGQYRAQLESLAQDLGLGDRVHFLGYRPDARQIIGGLDVLVLPSEAEGLPIVVLEAMSLGIPVVASTAGGIPEVVEDGRTGYLVALDDLEGLASAVARLLSRPEEARAMGARGRAKVRRDFSHEQMIERTFQLYQAAMEARA